MTKKICDPQVKKLIERLKELAKNWIDWDNCDGLSPRHCGQYLQEEIDCYLNQPETKINPPKWDNHDFAMHADGKDDDGHEINDCLTCKYKHGKVSMFGVACKNQNPCDYYSLWESKDD